MGELIDNPARRTQMLKDVIKELHNGMPPQEVKAKLKTLVCETDHSEIMAMEQELMAHGMPQVRSSACAICTPRLPVRC